MRHRKELQFGQEEHDALVEALELLSSTEQEDISLVLRAGLAMDAVTVVSLAKGQSDPEADMSAYQLAAQVLVDFRDPRAVEMLCLLHTAAFKLSLAAENVPLRTRRLEIATKALTTAVEVCELCYGKQHGQSVSLRGVESEWKRSRSSS